MIACASTTMLKKDYDIQFCHLLRALWGRLTRAPQPTHSPAVVILHYHAFALLFSLVHVTVLQIESPSCVFLQQFFIFSFRSIHSVTYSCTLFFLLLFSILSHWYTVVYFFLLLICWWIPVLLPFLSFLLFLVLYGVGMNLLCPRAARTAVSVDSFSS